MEKNNNNSNNIIELKNIVKTYDNGFTAVDGFNLEVKRGEFVTFLGPSGCGKTTTLRMIAGFEIPTSGEILLNGQDISKLPPNKRPINTVFQRYALFPHLNIFDNIAFGLKLKKLPKAEIVKKVKKVLEMVDLEGFEDRKVATLSGGQQQRIAIARALVNEPEILLLDENAFFRQFFEEGVIVNPHQGEAVAVEAAEVDFAIVLGLDIEAAQGAVIVIHDAEEDAVDDAHEHFAGPGHRVCLGEGREGLKPFLVACGKLVEPASLADDQIVAVLVRGHVHNALGQGAEQIRDGFRLHADEPVLLHLGRIGAYVLRARVRGHERNALFLPVGPDPHGPQHGCAGLGRSDVAGFLKSVNAVFSVNSYLHIFPKE